MAVEINETWEEDVLVFPAASRPNMSRRISLDPKILPMIFDTCPPILAVRLFLQPRQASGLIDLWHFDKKELGLRPDWCDGCSGTRSCGCQLELRGSDSYVLAV